MLFNSFDFAVFFPIVFILYWIVASRKNPRNLLLLIASYLFYGWWDWRFLFLIIISSGVDFLVGKKLYSTENPATRKLLLWTSLGVNLGFLVYFKYANFFIESFVDVFRLFGREIESSTLDIILPVGISFYTFQTLSYTIDIYRRKIEPTRDPLAFSTFVAFFPQLVAGPIERASNLLPQFQKTYKFNYDQVRSGLLLVAFGLFKKMVVADRVAILANEVYGNPTEYGGYQVLVGTLCFAFQVYCDFSGYSDIAIGLARTMGFKLMKNFDNPHLSKSITEVWRRWHISLSTWFRDYVYFSMGGNRKGLGRTYFNLFAVFVISGLWHGAAIHFVVWGALNGLATVVEKAFADIKTKYFNKIGLPRGWWVSKMVFVLLTFAYWNFTLVIFRANSMADAVLLVQGLGTANYSEMFTAGLFELGLGKEELYLALISIVLLTIFEWWHQKVNAMKVFLQQHFMVRWVAYLVIAYAIAIFGIYGEAAPQEFFYFQF